MKVGKSEITQWDKDARQLIREAAELLEAERLRLDGATIQLLAYRQSEFKEILKTRFKISENFADELTRHLHYLIITTAMLDCVENVDLMYSNKKFYIQSEISVEDY